MRYYLGYLSLKTDLSTVPTYKHAPITEAVIEIKFGSPLDKEVVEKASAKFSSHYPHDQRLENVKVALQLGTQEGSNPKTQVQHAIAVGHRRSSLDQTQLLVLFPSSFVISQLAPYSGWEEFYLKVYPRLANMEKGGRISDNF